MEARSLDYIADDCRPLHVSGRLDRAVTSISTDSRTMEPGALFVAIAGDRFDGHRFVEDAVARGAVGVVISDRAWEPTGAEVTTMQVGDTRKALGQIAARYRRDFKLPICAVSGSNGKTTTKELVASVLQTRLVTLKSPASFNNDIGVPLTLLQLDSGHGAGVVEIGTNHPGELAPLVAQAAPKIGVITNIEREHLEFFGDLEGVAAEEGSLAEAIPEDGALILNGDDPWSDALSGRCRGRVIRVGIGPGNDWRIVDWSADARGSSFKATAPQPALTGWYRVNLLGAHQRINAAYALAVGHELGVDGERMRQGLAACLPAPRRMELRHCDGVAILEDCYNANADSMRIALETLREYPCAGQRVAVLGDMAELGETSEGAHQEIGELAGKLSIDRLLTVGEQACSVAEKARDTGVAEVRAFTAISEVRAALREELRPGDVVLLKASRTMRLEQIGEGWWH